MDLKLKNILPMFMSLLLVSTSNAQSGVYDVTSANYGGKANSDITEVGIIYTYIIHLEMLN